MPSAGSAGEVLDPLGPTWEALAAAAPDEVARRSRCALAPDGRTFLVPFIDGAYLVNPATRTIRPADAKDTGRVNLEVGIVLLSYLVRAEDVSLAGKWITEKNLPSAGGAASRGDLDLHPHEELARAFGDRPEALVEVGRAIGARDILGAADATVQLNVLPRVPVRIQLWARDDEFDAHATILFDASIKHQLAPDAMRAMVSRLVKRLCCAVV